MLGPVVEFLSPEIVIPGSEKATLGKQTTTQPCYGKKGTEHLTPFLEHLNLFVGNDKSIKPRFLLENKSHLTNVAVENIKHTL